MTLSLVTLSGLTASFTNYTHDECNQGAKGRLPYVCEMIVNNITGYQRRLSMSNTTLHLSNLTDWSFSPMNTTVSSASEIPSSVKVASLISLFVFVLGFAVGYGPIAWLLLSEIFPTGIDYIIMKPSQGIR